MIQRIDLRGADRSTVDYRAAVPRADFDVEAETARLVELGATVVEERSGYRILADPGGLVFCVVPVQTPQFDEHAVTWPG